MKKVFLFIFVFITAFHFSFAQTEELMVKSGDKGLYLDHKVTPKENFYSIGRLFNAPPKEIAAYNKLDMNKGLSLGQMIQIPLSAVNFSQTVNEGTPVYYKVGEKEGLSKVSTINNKVPLENMRRWNNLSSDNVNFGSKLIVGFLISNEMPVVKIAEKKEPAPVIVGKTEKIDAPPVKINKEPVEENKVAEKPPVVINKEPAVENKVAEKLPVQTQTVKPVSSDQGYFKTSFDQQVKVITHSKEETVTAGIFKTTSGWQDAKYYALIDAVQPGTIIKIANPSNNKVVYAKVLGGMSGIRQNEGYSVRISNAAASALQITEQDKFIVKLNYAP